MPLRTRVAVFIAAAAAVGAAAGDGAKGAVVSTAGKPKWLVLSNFWPRESGPSVVGPASGRGWIGFSKGDVDSRSTVLGSLRRVGGNVSFTKAVLTASNDPMMIIGSQLFYHLPGGPPGELRSVPLLANGKVGPPSAVPADPEKVPPQELHPLAVDGIQVGGRSVWVLTGSKASESGGVAKAYLWACCSTTGELSGLSRFIDPKRPMFYLQLGRDTKGRLWLAWLDSNRQAPLGSVRMVELDPDTLAPRTAKALVAPDPGLWSPPRLVCADLCRVVASHASPPSGGDIFTWAPGARSATRMGLGTRQSLATFLDASFASGNLVVASAKTLQFQRPPWHAEEISIVRADARGSRARRVSSVAPAPFGARSRFQWQPPIYATFVPGGLVFYKLYYNFDHLYETRVLAGFLPLRD